MAIVFIEQAGIAFSLRDGERVVEPKATNDLSGLVYVTGTEYKKYPKNAQKIAQKTHKNRSYVIDEDIVYYYKAQDLENFNAELSPYQILINAFLKKKKIQGAVLLVDGNKDAVIASLIVNNEFKQLLISNANLINETLSDIRKILNKEKIKLNAIVLNDELYRPMFKNTQILVLSDTEILEFAQEFKSPVFGRIEDIKRKIQKARNKKLNIALLFASFIFVINFAAYLYTASLIKKYGVFNNNLNIKAAGLKQDLNNEIEKKFLTIVRLNVSKSLKNTLLKMGSVKNLKIDTIDSDGENFIVTGEFLGGYRNFVTGYNSLKNIMSTDILSYVVSSKGKVRFIIRGVVKNG